jgi:hypothetical protein
MMKKIFLILSGVILMLVTLQSCSTDVNEIESQLNTVEKRYTMFMTFDGCLKNITELNKDTANRNAQTKLVATILPETFKFLNGEIEYLNSIEVDEKNKEVLDRYKLKIGTLLAEHIKIFRLVFVEGAKQQPDYWGKLTLEGSNYDILRQECENKTQKSVIKMEVNNFMMIRFKKIIQKSDDFGNEEIEIESPLDSELIPMKL